jgi:thiamine pyrophosphate-dependent acetolactate synthase large subunit-like protein
MNNQELATAVENNLTLPIVILNDSGYGAIRHIQERACGGRYVASNWKSPDLVQIAKGFGAEGTLITEPQNIETSLRAALAANKPAVLDIRIDGDEKLPRNRLPSGP